MVPEDTDGFGALLGGDQAELHSDGFVQRVLQQLVVVVDCDTDHRCVDDRTLWHPDENEKNIFSFNSVTLDVVKIKSKWPSS